MRHDKSSTRAPAPAESSPRPDRATLVAFAVLVVLGGGNAVAVRYSNQELAPLWGAAARFLAAAVIFWAILLVRRVGLPRGKALLGSMVYGALAVGASFGFLYWGLVEVQASLGIVILSLNPLLTMLFAVAHRLEPFRLRGFVGALVAVAGIAIGVGEQFGRSVPVASVAAVVLGVVCLAEGAVVYKRFPASDPLQGNAVAFATGASMLTAASLLAGEEWALPRDPSTIAAYAYLVLLGSVLVFYLYLHILSRWTASATSYAFLLFPVAGVSIAAIVAGERVTWVFLAGVAVALVGVWIGAFGGRKDRPPEPDHGVESEPVCGPLVPGCA
jgi:drug/metabolite transporter (DMT)-like permease